MHQFIWIHAVSIRVTDNFLEPYMPLDAEIDIYGACTTQILNY